MNKLPSTLRVSLNGDGLPFTKDTSGIEMAGLQGEFPVWLRKNPGLMALVGELEELTGRVAQAVMVNRLAPGVTVHKHVDPDRGWARYHLPLRTNEESWWWDEENGTVHMSDGFWWGPMDTTKLHQVGNGGNTERIHLVVDLA